MMTDGKVDLPVEILPLNESDLLCPVKDEGVEAFGKERIVVGLVEDSKDLVQSESTIPLSPQWLYSKQVEPKTSLPGASGELRGPNPLLSGISTDSNQKEGWRLDGFNKKELLRAAPDLESSRRWREEERETGLLGRKDRKRDRVDVISTKVGNDNNRNTVPESWRDKWSSSWGPEEKAKDLRSEWKGDAENMEIHNEKQAFVGGNRLASERSTESRDKWKPRHRVDIQTGGSSSYRSAPGFGLERGRVEASIVRFAPGRGRSTINGSSQIGRPISSGPIGHVSLDKSGTYCYPRAKLLDIYRSKKILHHSSLRLVPMEEASPLTQDDYVVPLAFLPPIGEEEAVLGDMWLGNIIGGEVLHNSCCDKNEGSDENSTDVSDTKLSEEEKSSCNSGDGFEFVGKPDGASDRHDTITRDLDPTTFPKSVVGGTYKQGKENPDFSFFRENGDFGKNIEAPAAFEEQAGQQRGYSVFPKDLEPDEGEAAASIDFSLLKDSLNTIDQSHLKSMDTDTDDSFLLGTPNFIEELSLFYLDPQGVVQGPFLGIDIISWLEQGFFGTDLPVRLSTAPEGTPFQELGEVVPYLKMKASFGSNTNVTNKLEETVNFSDKLEEAMPASATVVENKESSRNNQQPDSTFSLFSQPDIHFPDTHTKPLYSEDSDPQNLTVRDEEIVFPGRPSRIHTPAVASVDVSYFNSSSHPSLAPAFTETNRSTHLDKGNDIDPFGLFVSELKARNLSCAQPSSFSIGDHGPPLLDRDSSNVGYSHFSAMADQPTVSAMLSDNFRNNTFSTPNFQQSSMDPHHNMFHMERDFNGAVMEEQSLMSHKLQAELFQQKNQLLRHPKLQYSEHPSMNQAVPDLEHLLDLQFQQKQQLELQRQQKLQQQQQLLHRQIKLQQQQLQFQQQQEQQQQYQVQQLLLEELLHRRMSESTFRHSEVDQGVNFLRNQLLQNPTVSRHLDPTLEQFIRAKNAHAGHRGRINEISELLAGSKAEKLIDAEQHFLYQQEQLQARRLATPRQPAAGLDGMVWPIDETHQFNRRDADFNSLSFQQLQQQQQMDFYDSSPLSLERSTSFHSGFPRMPPAGSKSVNSGLQSLDIMERHPYMQSSDDLGPFSTSCHTSYLPRISDRLYSSDAAESSNSRNSWLGAQMEHLHLENLKKNDAQAYNIRSDYSNMWSLARDDDNMSGIMREKLGRYSELEPHLLPSTFENREFSNHPLDPFSGQNFDFRNSFTEVPQNLNVRNIYAERLNNVGMNEELNNVDGLEGNNYYNPSYIRDAYFSDKEEKKRNVRVSEIQNLMGTNFGDSLERVEAQKMMTSTSSSRQHRSSTSLSAYDEGMGAEDEKDVYFRRTSSCCSDAAGAGSETSSFMEMLKKPAAAEESGEGGVGGRSGKKKAKKGKQIDPALLGFKVSSNRIMMGEIQRPDE